MVLAKEIMGISLLEKSSSFINPSKVLLNCNFYHKENQLWVNQGRRNLRPTKALRQSPMAAISENLIKVVPEKAVKFKVRAIVTVKNKNKEDLKETLVKHLDAFTEKIGRNVALELISTDMDPNSKEPKKSNQAVLKDWSKKSNLKTERVNYTAEFVVDSNFGTPGAITVTNKHQQEFFLESITIEGFACGPVHFPCNSWVQPKKDHPTKRIFFSNKPYLPNETPAGLIYLRERELRDLRGDGTGVRKLSHRIYDYDIYNDLGNPDKGIDFARPKLGGKDNVPYPRRCRTGRVPTDTDMSAESRVEKPNPTYVPRDEQFEESKMNAFSTGRLKGVLHNLIPSLMASISSNNHDFKGFSDIDSLYSEGLLLKLGLQDEVLKKLPLPKVVSSIKEGNLLKYDTPKILSINETPAGLIYLRERELRDLRGDGTGVRKLSHRIYDYDIYNDLGNPDKGIDFARPKLGGKDNVPYPRRCRTGRVPTDTDMSAESRVEKPNPTYVPRDEQFEESKMNAFSTGRLKGVLHNLIPSLMASISSNNHDFKGFSDIDSLYSEGLLLKLGLQDEVLKKLPLPKVVSSIKEGNLLKYDTPKILSKDRFAWLRDDEFARQAIAGVNPVTIERLQVFPPVSKLDPEIYGPQESALKEEHILGNLNGMTVQEALDANRLFIVDYHDIYLPFLDRINALDGRNAYATRTIYFLSDLGTLKPISIELSLPQTGPSSRSKRVVTPPVDATGNWMWQLAKAHVCSNDAGVHQLVNHWLRTHACLEPFILAAHRQLSAMHPIYKLLDPHMRYNLEINGLARQSLINADGVIEACFTPGRYCMEMSAAAYKNWRFDLEGLPADLIRRGIAVPDSTHPRGLKLLIEDYPYAADGLMIWAAIEGWVRNYVNHYYQDSAQVCNDRELQAWYAESINVGHADLRNAEWWPTLATPEDLISILTTIIWLASAQHAALNFGQYPYGGYVPNRPPLMRRLIPDENDPEYTVFLADPQKYFFSALPSLLQATKFMAVVDTLSTHSLDEEYIGERHQPSTWTGDADIIEAFYEFSAEIRRIEKEIDEKNADTKLRNRCGAGVLPYELLAPSSGPGVTCRGVPNSVSI